MRTLYLTICFFCMCMLFAGGCESTWLGDKAGSKIDNQLKDFSCIDFAPVKIHVMPLTEIFISKKGDIGQSQVIKTYVSFLDSFDCQIKWPASFRFELYEKVLRSAEPKGKRIAIWPDVDLTSPAENNIYWRDFLRAYRFELDFEGKTDRSYILHISVRFTDGKRLWADFDLKPAQ